MIESKYKFFKDEQWEEIFQKEANKKIDCPYDKCDGHIHQKGTKKRECSYCDLTIYGNPLFLSYKQEEKDKAVILWNYIHEIPVDTINRKYSKISIKLYNGYKKLDKTFKLKKAIEVECAHEKTHYAIEEQELVCMQCGEVLAGRPHYVAGSLKVKYAMGYIFDDTQYNKP